VAKAHKYGIGKYWRYVFDRDEVIKYFENKFNGGSKT